jgi:hypothetical protein
VSANGRSLSPRSQLIAWWRAHWVAGFIAMTLLIGLAGQYNLWRQIGRPFPGFLSYSNLHGGFWTVAENTPPWWPGISQSGLQYSDRVMKLDGQPFGVDQAAVFNQAYQANRPVMVTISRQGVEMALETAVIPFSLTHFLEIKIPHIIIGFGFWLLALTIYATRPAEPLNQMFALVACLTAINQWLWIRFLFHLESHPLAILHMYPVRSGPCCFVISTAQPLDTPANLSAFIQRDSFFHHHIFNPENVFMAEKSCTPLVEPT